MEYDKNCEVKTGASIVFFQFYGEIEVLLVKKTICDLKISNCNNLSLTTIRNTLLYAHNLSRGGEIGRRGGFKIRCQR